MCSFKNVKFLIILGLIHVFQPLLSGNEICIMKAKDKSRLTVAKLNS
jgi:hypothetical protein